MDAMRVDAWTRRRLGQATGGLAAAAIGLTTSGTAGKKKGKKKKKNQ